MLLTWSTVLLAVALLLLLCWLPIRRFRRYGVKHLTPLPLFGDMTRVVFKKLHLFENFDRIYRSFPNERFVGLSELIRPVVLIRDLELAKKIVVSDFDCFHDHSAIVDKNIDTIFGGGFFGLKGQEWRDMRRTMSRTFTTFKLKQMVNLIEEVGDRIMNQIEKSIRENEKNYNDVEFGETCSHFTFDIVASCCFGLKVDSQDPDNAEFYDMGKTLSQIKRPQLFNFFGFQSFPKIMKVLRITMLQKEAENFFKKLMNQVMEERVSQKVYRPDVVDVLLEARKEHTDDDLLAQALFFFIAGYETVSVAMTMAVLAMANHQDIQEKLAQEIQAYDLKCGGKIDYDVIQQLTYLDMVISETLRLWATSFAERVCTKDYNLGRPNDSATEDYIIRKGEGLIVSLRSFMLDAKYFPEPDRFDPERFSTENRHKIPQFAYNPFGKGPRACLGNRFAVSVMKMMIYHLLRRLRILPCAQTSVRVRLSNDHLVLRNKEGCRVRLELRE